MHANCILGTPVFSVCTLKSLDLPVGLTGSYTEEQNCFSVPVIQGVAGVKATNLMCAIVIFYSIQMSLATVLAAFRFRLPCPLPH